MILFSLQCARGDRFDAWFRSGSDFDAQASAGRVECPFCGSSAVEKSLMAPAVPASTRNAAAPVREAPAAAPVEGATPVPAPSPPVAQPVAAGPELAKAFELMQRIAREVRAKSDYVGPRFAEEARKIHFEEAPPRSIYGEASAAEMRELAEDGVGFQPLPPLPEDKN